MPDRFSGEKHLTSVADLLLVDVRSVNMRRHRISRSRESQVPPKRLIPFLIAAFCRLAKSPSHSQQKGWLVGAVGIEHDPRTTKSRGIMALQPPTKSNC
jgi:hypothetical protein